MDKSIDLIIGDNTSCLLRKTFSNINCNNYLLFLYLNCKLVIAIAITEIIIAIIAC